MLVAAEKRREAEMPITTYNLTDALNAAITLSDILHALEKRGVELTDKEHRQWYGATCLIEKTRKKLNE